MQHFVLKNVYLLKLFQLKNLFFFIYAEIKQALIDVEKCWICRKKTEKRRWPDEPPLSLGLRGVLWCNWGDSHQHSRAIPQQG